MIELEGISKTYRVRAPKEGKRFGLPAYESVELKALDDIRLRIKMGEVFGILGPNGAGKTTLIKVIAGLLLPDENGGSGSVNGYDLIKDRERVRTSVNLLRSGDWVIFDYKLSIMHNLVYWGVISGLQWSEIEDRVRAMSTIVGLGDKLDEFPENLSAGMRQKMSLARTMLSDRPVFLLDEPTANIDPISAQFIRQFARDALARAGKSVVLATHNLWEAEMICDRILILDKGKILLIGPTEEIKQQKGEEYAVMGVTKLNDGLVKELEGLEFVDRVMLDGEAWEGTEMYYKLRVFGQIKLKTQVLMLAAALHTKVIKLEIKEPSLNEIFMKLLGREGR